MCKHQYNPSGLGDMVCPLPALIEKYQDLKEFSLPYDKEGVCLFHSKDMEWKKADFLPKFIELLDFVRLINEKIEGEQPLQAMEFQFVCNKENAHLLKGLTIPYILDFRYATFYNATMFTDCQFSFVNLAYAQSKARLAFEKCSFDTFYAMSGVFAGFSFMGNEVKQTVLFSDAAITAFCEFSKNTLEGFVSFKNAKISSYSEGDKFLFSQNLVKGDLDFTKTQFNIDVLFEEPVFEGVVDFVDTKFYETRDCDFFDIKLRNQLNFRSTSSSRKMFENTVALLVDGKDINGTIFFENVNYYKILAAHRENLKTLVKHDKVIIGSGCIKYRLQTPLQKIEVSQHNQVLIQELSNTFAQFFKNDSNLNLGVEIEKQTEEYIELFYFSDAAISEREFFQRLFESEEKMWALIQVEDNAVKVNSTALTGFRNKLLLGSDAMINLGAIGLKIASRFVIGKLTEEELAKVLQTTPNGLSTLPKLASNYTNVYQVSLLTWKSSQSSKI